MVVKIRPSIDEGQELNVEESELRILFWFLWYKTIRQTETMAITKCRLYTHRLRNQPKQQKQLPEDANRGKRKRRQKETEEKG